MNDEEIRPLFLALIQSVKQIINSEKVKGTIKANYELYERWEVTSFDYDDTGLHCDIAVTQIKKSTWLLAFIKIKNLIEKTKEYNTLFDFLKIKFDIKKNEPNYINRFVHRVVSKYLESDAVSDSEIEEMVNIILLDLKNKPVKSGAIVQLVGIILQEDEIEISHEILLRKPKREDFEIDLPFSFFRHFPLFPEPSAFLEISLKTKTSREIQEEVSKATTILRLFRIGSVKWTTYRMFTESFSQFLGGTTTSGDNLPALNNYLLKNHEIDRLKVFWERISHILPPIFYRFDIGKSDHVSIAYDRYSDALLQSGIIERRIANAIMGLEALYFKPSGEQQELIYRLGIRVAKVLGNFSFDPIQTRSAIKDAYTIRSIFSHGGHLEYKQKKKFNEKYNGDINNLLNNILDFLRVSIIISMTIRLEKGEFIDTIDNALIDQNANQRLTNILNQAKNILE